MSFLEEEELEDRVFLDRIGGEESGEALVSVCHVRREGSEKITCPPVVSFVNTPERCRGRGEMGEREKKALWSPSVKRE